MRAFSTTADVERFLLVHGEHIVDILGSEVDRIESKIKVSGHNFMLVVGVIGFFFSLQKHAPEVRHLDLEIL